MSEESFAESFAEIFEREYADLPKLLGSMVIGRVVKLQDGIATVDAGLKLLARVPMEQFSDEDSVTIGSEHNFCVEKMEDNYGQCLLSRSRARREEAWSNLGEYCNSGKPIECRVLQKTRSGYIVNALGAPAFLPANQARVGRQTDRNTDIIGQTITVYVSRMDRSRGNVLVSRQLSDKYHHGQGNSNMHDAVVDTSAVKVGDVLEATVFSLRDHGALIKLDESGIVGFMHLRDISWERTEKVSDALEPGQKATVKVIKVGNGKVSLSIKELTPSPAKTAAGELSVGQLIEGHVTNVVDYGFFVRIKPFLSGLVHSSEASWDNCPVHSIVKHGDPVKVVVLSVDPEQGRVNLSLKKAIPNPWTHLAQRYNYGSTVEVTVTCAKDNYLVVRIVDGLHAMIRGQDLSTSMSDIAVDDTIETVVIFIDGNEGKVRLAMKDSMPGKLANMVKGKVYTCTVVSVSDIGLKVKIGDIDGFIKRVDLARDTAGQRPNLFAENNRLDAVLQKISFQEQLAYMSVKSVDKAREVSNVKQFGSTRAGASLTNLFGGSLLNIMSSPDAKDSKATKDTKADAMKDAAPEKKAKTPKVTTAADPSVKKADVADVASVTDTADITDTAVETAPVMEEATVQDTKAVAENAASAEDASKINEKEEKEE